MMLKNKVVGVASIGTFLFLMSGSIVRQSQLGSYVPFFASEEGRKLSTDEFPYPLECRENDLIQYLLDRGITPNDGENVKIAITYHVGMLNNWETVVRDQMTTLEKCGLGKVASDILLSYANGEIKQLQDVLQEYDFPIMKDIQSAPSVKATKAPFEGGAMNLILDYCQKQEHPESTVMFYFHDKAVSRWSEDWKEKMDQSKSYAYSLYWRKYMEYFLIERPQICLDQLLFQGKKTCGVMWKRSVRDPKMNHYSGNFWSATCDYIAHTRKPIPDEIPDKWWRNVAAELWVGGDDGSINNPDYDPDMWHASLSNTNVSPYTVLMAPEGYRYPGNEFSHLLGVEAKEKLVFTE